MRKLSGLFLLVLLLGCPRQEDGIAGSEGWLNLELGISGLNRTITPEEPIMNIAYYVISGIHTDYSFGPLILSRDNPVLKKSLYTGVWDIHVKGMNTSDTEIAAGSTSVTIEGGRTSTASVTLRPLEGEGTFRLSINAGVLSGPLSIRALLDNDREMEFTQQNGIYSGTINLPAGYYTLNLSVTEAEVTKNLVEAIRIIRDAVTEFQVTLQPGLSLQIIEELNNPLTITLSANRDPVPPGSSVTVTADCSAQPETWSWFLNGIPLAGSGDRITLETELVAGNNTVTLLCTSAGIISSASLVIHVDTSALGEIDYTDTFDDGQSPNNWGGDYASFSTQDAAINAYYSAPGLDGTGLCYALDYDVPHAGSYAGLTIPLAETGNTVDLTEYEYLSLEVRGSREKIPLKIQLKNASSDQARNSAFLYINDYLDGGITTGTCKVDIPLDTFLNLDSRGNVSELVLVFEHDYAEVSGYPSAGILYLDNLGFGKTAGEYLRVDSFGDRYGWQPLGGNSGSMGNHTSEFITTDYTNPAYCFRSSYDVSGGWAGFYLIFGGGEDGFTPVAGDFSAYRFLSFRVKTPLATANPGTFKMELVDDSATHNIIIPGDTREGLPLSTQWQKYSIDLANLSGADTTSLKQLNIIYEDWRVDNTAGVLFFDDIQFEK